MSEKKEGIIVILSSPSGAGKTSLVKEISSKNVLCVSSGTSALHTTFLSLGIKKNDVVIVPSINFVAATNMLENIGAKIVFSDVDPIYGQMNLQNILDCIKKNKIKKEDE